MVTMNNVSDMNGKEGSDVKIKQVQMLKQLGSVLTDDGKRDTKTQRRIAIAKKYVFP